MRRHLPGSKMNLNTESIQLRYEVFSKRPIRYIVSKKKTQLFTEVKSKHWLKRRSMLT